VLHLRPRMRMSGAVPLRSLHDGSYRYNGNFFTLSVPLSTEFERTASGSVCVVARLLTSFLPSVHQNCPARTSTVICGLTQIVEVHSCRGFIGRCSRCTVPSRGRSFRIASVPSSPISKLDCSLTYRQGLNRLKLVSCIQAVQVACIRVTLQFAYRTLCKSKCFNPLIVICGYTISIFPLFSVISFTISGSKMGTK
jgi:hypothetical protein